MYAINEAPPDTEERTPLVQEVEEQEEVADGVIVVAIAIIIVAINVIATSASYLQISTTPLEYVIVGFTM